MKPTHTRRANILTESTLGLVVSLFVLFLLMYWTRTLYTSTTTAIPHEICKDSVLRAAALNTRYTDFGAQVQCETDNIIIDDLASTQAQTLAKSRIAESLTNCWDRFGKGELNLFGGQGTYCHICNYVEFTDHTTPLEGLNTYLHTGFIPGTSTTYASYLTAATTTPDISRDALDAYRLSAQHDHIDPASKDLYATVFYYVKGKDPHREAMNSLTSGATVIGTIAIGFVVVKVGVIAGAAVLTYTGISALVSGTTATIGAALTPITSQIPTFISIGRGLFSAGTTLSGRSGRALIGAGSAGLSSTAAYLDKQHYDHYASVWFVPHASEQLKAMGCTELVRATPTDQ